MDQLQYIVKEEVLNSLPVCEMGKTMQFRIHSTSFDEATPNGRGVHFQKAYHELCCYNCYFILSMNKPWITREVKSFTNKKKRIFGQGDKIH